MKKDWRVISIIKNWCIVVTIINLVLLLFLLWLLYYKPYVCFKGEDVTTFLGILISCISIVITMYFVILAVRAYGDINDIKKNTVRAKANADSAFQKAQEARAATDNTKELLLEIQDANNIANETLQHISNAAEICFSSILNFLETAQPKSGNREIDNRFKELKYSVLRTLYRLSLHPRLLNETTRISYILNLATFGDESDIASLETICESGESTAIKKTAKTVIDALKEKVEAQKAKSK